MWHAWLEDDPSRLTDRANLAFVFPFRRETLPVLEWATAHDDPAPPTRVRTRQSLLFWAILIALTAMLAEWIAYEWTGR